MMDPTSLAKIAEWCEGSLLQGVPDTMAVSISTDSRSIVGGEVFLALKGDKFDGHEFIEEVDKKGVAGVIVSDLSEATESCSCGIIHVRHVLAALQNLASGYRRSLRDTFVLGVTGSNGKTSTKDFLYAVMAATGSVNANVGNLNNHIGMPLTVLDTNSGDQSVILEMGMNHPGEIEVLAEIGRPHAAVITNIGTAHIEHMKTKDAIAAEKSSLPEVVPSAGFCVMPIDDAYYSFVEERVSCRMVSVGNGSGDVRASNIVINDSGKTSFWLSRRDDEVGHQVNLSVRGSHMVTNALLAAAVGFEQGISGDKIAAALSAAKLTGGRLEERRIGGVDYLDDSYNANPESMRAAIAVLSSAPVVGRRVAVLGFMGELGESAESEHNVIGAEIARREVDLLVTVGDRANGINHGAKDMSGIRVNFDNHKEASKFLRDTLDEGDLALVKGSRAAGMEKIFEFLEQ